LIFQQSPKDAPVELDVPVHAELIALGVVIETGHANRGPMPRVGLDRINQPGAAADLDDLAGGGEGKSHE
jgi:hypothetical protein